MFNLKGKQALITGGNSGIGFGISKAMVLAGANVVLVGKNQKKNENAVKELGKINNNIICSAIKFDLLQIYKIKEFFQDAEKKYGTFDILINCAGITIRKRADLLTIQEWEKIIRLNLTSTFVLTREWAKSLIRKKIGGSCVIILSLMSEAARPTTAAYGSSKAALKHLVKSLAVDWGHFNIRVNGIGPGYIKTNLTQSLYKNKKFSEWVISRTPLGRWGIPDDVGPAAVFLCCDESRFITGQTIFVDGGWLASL